MYATRHGDGWLRWLFLFWKDFDSTDEFVAFWKKCWLTEGFMAWLIVFLLVQNAGFSWMCYDIDDKVMAWLKVSYFCWKYHSLTEIAVAWLKGRGLSNANSSVNPKWWCLNCSEYACVVPYMWSSYIHSRTLSFQLEPPTRGTILYTWGIC